MRTVISFAVAMILAGSMAWGQATAQIQGIVRDASGSSVPGAEVKATQTETGAARTVPTGADGTYVLANLPVGPYRIEVGKTGFTTFVQTGIVLQVATSPTVDIALKVGNVSEQVQVEANAALVETQSTNIGTVIENQRILELPLNGRVATDLIQLAGAAIPQGVAGAGGFPGTGQIIIAGGQAFGVGSSWTAAFTTILGIMRIFLCPSRMRCRNSRSRPARSMPATACTPERPSTP